MFILTGLKVINTCCNCKLIEITKLISLLNQVIIKNKA